MNRYPRQCRGCYWWGGLALLASEFHRLDMMHLVVWFADPASHCGHRMAARVRAAGWPWIARRTLVIVLTASLGDAAGADCRDTAVSVDTSRRGPVMFRCSHAMTRWTSFTRTFQAGESLFVYPYYPMYYFLADVTNPTRYSILMYHINTPAQFDEVIRDLEAGQVKYVLWDTWVAGANLTQWFPGYHEPPPDEQLLERYLEESLRGGRAKESFPRASTNSGWTGPDSGDNGSGRPGLASPPVLLQRHVNIDIPDSARTAGPA